MADEVFVQVVLKNDTAIDRDKVVNTFAFSDVVVDQDREDIFDALVRFYNVAAGAPAFSIASQLSPALNTGALQSEMRMYDIRLHLDGSPHGSPIDTRLWTLGASAAAAALPSEVAMALTLEAIGWDQQPVEGAAGVRPRSRFRGRLYLGPWGTGVNEMNAGVSRPSGDLRDVCFAAAARLKADAVATGANWCLWSRARAACTPIVSASSANDWDTMRSRGERASARGRLVF